MKSSRIVAGGGWIIRQRDAKPKARLCAFLSVLWLAVAIPGVLALLFLGSESASGLPWISLLLVAPEPVLVFLAVLFWLKEKPRLITEQRPNPDFDLRKLY